MIGSLGSSLFRSSKLVEPLIQSLTKPCLRYGYDTRGWRPGFWYMSNIGYVNVS